MLQTAIQLTPVLPAGMSLNAGQTQAIKEIGAALEVARSSDKPTFIVLRAVSGTGKSQVLDGLREQLKRIDVEILENPDDMFNAAFSKERGKRFIVPVLPGVSIHSILPGGSERPYESIEISMRGFTKDELRVRIPRDLRTQPADVIESLLDLSHGSTTLLQLLVRELKANGFKPLTPEAAADIAAGFIANNLQSRGALPSMEQYRKFCDDFTRGEFKLGLDLDGASTLRIPRERVWMMDARRTSAEFKEHEPWDRYARIASFAATGMRRLDEPGITVIAISNSPEDTRKLVNFSEEFEQHKLERAEGVHYRKSRIAVYSAPDFTFARGWSTSDHDEVSNLRFSLAPSEPRAHALLEVHTHEHQFEGKFLQFAALAESGLRKLGMPYYLKFHAGNAHPVTIYFDPVTRSMEPISFTALRYLSGETSASCLLGRDSDPLTWKIVEASIREAAIQGQGNALLHTQDILPLLSSEYYRGQARYLIREFEENLNKHGSHGERYQAFDVEAFANSAKHAEIRSDTTAIVIVGYNDYKFRAQNHDIQRSIDAAAGARKVILAGSGRYQELFVENTPWTSGRFKDAQLYELSFQRGGVRSLPLKASIDRSDAEAPFVEWIEDSAAKLFKR